MIVRKLLRQISNLVVASSGPFYSVVVIVMIMFLTSMGSTWWDVSLVFLVTCACSTAG